MRSKPAPATALSMRRKPSDFERQLQHHFTMDLACKDLGFATKFGRDFGVPLKLAGLTEQIFVEGRQAYGGEAWSSQIVKLLEDALHTDLRAPGFPAELE